jgi:hypothetical protein
MALMVLLNSTFRTIAYLIEPFGKPDWIGKALLLHRSNGCSAPECRLSGIDAAGVLLKYEGRPKISIVQPSAGQLINLPYSISYRCQTRYCRLCRQSLLNCNRCRFRRGRIGGAVISASVELHINKKMAHDSKTHLEIGSFSSIRHDVWLWDPNHRHRRCRGKATRCGPCLRML